MVKLKIHRKENFSVDRYHNKWFEDFKNYLQKYFDVEYVSYQTDGVTSHIDLRSDVSHYNNTPPISDVDMVIENLDNNEFVCISFTEYFNSFVVHLTKSDKFKGMLLSHFNYHHLYYWLKRDDNHQKMHLIKPWIFPFYNEFDVDHCRSVRSSSNHIDELFFKGSGCDESGYRKAVGILSSRGLIDTSNIDHKRYLEEMSKAKVALSYYQDLDKYVTPFDYPGEFCYRDMEYIAVGVPFIRIEYRDCVHKGLYPNHHYISINREVAYETYKNRGNQGIADLLYEKYLEVKDDDRLLQQISTNQKQYYDQYVRWPRSAELAIDLLGIRDWINPHSIGTDND